MGLGRVAHGDGVVHNIKHPPPMEQATNETEPRERWIDLWYDFTQDTTFHGVRHITQKKSYTLRRILWLFVILGCLVGFVYAMAFQLMYLISMPKAVNVEVIYNDTLTFPAVTICNQNFFRGSKTFEMGLYDQVNDRFSSDTTLTSASSYGGCVEGQFDLTEGRFVTKSSHYTPLQFSEGYFATYEQVTLYVCKQICLMFHDAICNAFAYGTGGRRCALTSLTPSLTLATINDTFIHEDPNVDTYERKRCYGLRKTTCNFDTGLCEFYKKEDMSSRWQRHSGPTSTAETGPDRDHTSVIGYYMYVEPVIEPFGNTDSTHLISPFISTPDNKPICASFAYSLVGLDDDLGQLKISRRSALEEDHLLWSVSGVTQEEWELDLVFMGSGLFQLAITVDAGRGSRGDVAIDDVSVGPCSEFVGNCRRTVKGNTYIGTVSKAINGQSCMPWNETYYFWRYENFNFPIYPSGNEAYCRNPNHNLDGPWCYVQNGSSFSPEQCDVPFCACDSNQFGCRNGLCVHQLLTCDGVDHCGDGTDETTGCVISPTCTFEKGNSCGYNLDPFGLIAKGKSSWIRYKGQIHNGNLRRDHTLDSKLGHFLYLDSGSVTLAYRERVAVGSPLVSGTNTTQCLQFYLYNKKDVIQTEAMGDLRVYQTFGKYHRRPLAIFSGTTINAWELKSATIPAATMDFNITLEAAVGYSYYSDMAVDDVVLKDGSCFKEAKCGIFFPCGGTCIPPFEVCDGQFHCADFSDEDPYECETSDKPNCTFSTSYMCGYRDDSNPDHNGWQRITTPFFSYMHVHDEEPPKDVVKRFVSPRLFLGDDSCLGFQYTSNSYYSYCLLSIYREFLDNRTLSYKVGGTGIGETPVWYNGYVTISSSSEMALTFEAACSALHDKVEISIMAVSLTTGSCEDQFDTDSINCKFVGGDMCGFLDMSREGITWVPFYTAIGPDLQDSLEPGIFAELPSIANINSENARLLFPTLTVANTTCVYVEMEVLSNAPITVRFHEYLQPNTEYNQMEFYSTRLTEIQMEFKTGEYRLALSAAISISGRLKIHSVATSSSECPFNLVKGLQPNLELPRSRIDRGRSEAMFPEEGLIQLTSQMPTVWVRETPISKEENLTTYYREASHQVNTLIYRCQWSGQPCTSSNFTSQITDFGYCHTFNPGKKGRPILKTASTGSSAGLRLILNVEQYDYMRGPQSDAGVKIFLADHKEVPQIRDLGFAVGPGDHAFVAVKLSQSESLPSPWGNCGVQDLEYQYDENLSYTYSACLRECETKAMVETCGCRDAYMPSKTADDPPICNITTYLGCAVGTAAQFGDMSVKCNCTEPCHRGIYEPQLSYAELSRLSVNQLLTSNLEHLNRTHREALEINQRVDAEVISQDLRLFSTIQSSYNELLTFAFREAWKPEQSFVIKVERSLAYFVQYILYSDVSQSVIGIAHLLQSAFDINYGPIYATIQEQSSDLLVQIEVLARMYDKYITDGTGDFEVETQATLATQTLNSLKQTIETFHGAIKSKSSVYKESNIVQNADRIPGETYILDIQCESTIYSFIKQNAIPDRLSTITESLLEETSPSSLKSTLSKLVSDYGNLKTSLSNTLTCLGEYLSFLQGISRWNTQFKQSYDTLLSSMRLTDIRVTINDLLDYVDETELMTDFQIRVSDLSNAFNLGTLTKEAIGNVFDGEGVSTAVQNVDTFVSRITNRLIAPRRSMIQEVKTLINGTYTKILLWEQDRSKYFAEVYEETQLRSLRLWRRPKANPDTADNPYYATDVFQLGNLKKFIEVHSSKVLSELADWYTRPLEDAINRFETKLKAYQSDVTSTLGNMQTQATRFRQQSLLGSDFIKENFIAVDVFFAQLKYERTEQIKAYSIDSFLGDIGGFMGLLLGGSVLSLIEILDLVVYNCVRKVRQHRKQEQKAWAMKRNTQLILPDP